MESPSADAITRRRRATPNLAGGVQADSAKPNHHIELAV